MTETLRVLVAGALMGVVTINFILFIIAYNSYRTRLKDGVPLRRRPRAFVLVTKSKLQRLNVRFVTKAGVISMIAWAVLYWVAYVFVVGFRTLY